MLRMSRAINRAMVAATPGEQERASRWVAAWGMIGGIRSGNVRLRDPELLTVDPAQRHPESAPAD
ncbi:hypothetical protein [Massilia cavernae]|uniref:hypothetical protein n=1 Tax=Massilia cavernae TaxID=2320864 RepID=UPI0011C3921F|nr:hypothetical protein [Massilia cavernae]